MQEIRLTTYRYETITAAEALAIGEGDTVLFAVGAARTYMASYGLLGDGQITSVTLDNGGRAVTFGANLVPLSQAGRLSFPDVSMMRLGGAGADAFTGGD